jgi:hypothetical protein
VGVGNPAEERTVTRIKTYNYSTNLKL